MKRRRQPRGQALLLVLGIGALMVVLLTVPLAAVYRLHTWNRYHQRRLEQRALTVILTRAEPEKPAEPAP